MKLVRRALENRNEECSAGLSRSESIRAGRGEGGRMEEDMWVG